jgi:hypothetical protein
LEQHNPNIDWINKTLQIEATMGLIKLQGHRSSVQHCSAISVSELVSACRQGSVAHLVHVYALDDQICMEEITPKEVQTVINQFEDVFASPTALPPRRACDHSIPLIQGDNQ